MGPSRHPTTKMLILEFFPLLVLLSEVVLLLLLAKAYRLCGEEGPGKQGRPVLAKNPEHMHRILSLKPAHCTAEVAGRAERLLVS